MASGWRLHAARAQKNPAATARDGVHGPVRSSNAATIESSPSPCAHSAWLLMTHVVVPNANAPSRQIAVQMGLIASNDAVTDAERAHGHRRTYRLDTLERDVRAAGLQVVHSGGVFFKPLANYQFDKLLGGDVISDGYLEGCYRLGLHYPDLCASVYAVCERVVPKA